MIRGHPLKPAVFLDRDGVIVEDVHHLSRPEQLSLVPGAAMAIRRLNQLGIPVVVITNQSVVARGLVSEAALEIIHQRLAELLTCEGAHVDGLYYCPHHPHIGEQPYRIACDCRKPEPGLFLRAAADLDLALERSAMIGDSLHDLEAGRRAGCRTAVLVRTGHGAAELSKAGAGAAPADFVASDLHDAVRHLIEKRLVG